MDDQFTRDLHQQLYLQAEALTQQQRNAIAQIVYEAIGRGFREPGYSGAVDNGMARAMLESAAPNADALVAADVFCQTYGIERGPMRNPPAVAADLAKRAVAAFHAAAPASQERAS